MHTSMHTCTIHTVEANTYVPEDVEEVFKKREKKKE